MKVLVLGDVIIDKYIYGTSTRISPEAPVPIVDLDSIKTSLGGAGLVYENLKSLGVDVLLVENEQPKSTKTRIIADGHYVTRLDEDEQADSDAVLKNVLRSDFSQYEYVILSDYNKGVLTHATQIIEHMNSQGCKVIVDPKRNRKYYKGAWLVKPNAKEYTEFGFNKHKGNIITTSANGAVSAKFEDETHFIIPEQVEVNDVTGAGDCFLAAFVYGLTQGKTIKQCLELATKGATESVKHLGTYTLSKTDLEDNVVFTNGCFDILHIGHLKLLRHARSLGNRLVVAINSDASVKRLKGETRPINNQETRKETLEQLGIVDEVIIFDEDTPYETIKELNPNIIVKGGDYTVETVVGNDLAEVVIFPIVEGHSTTQVIKDTK
jgi:D-beta-D-heptose 7-phosphate kinase/D-beta-D-heptose 1-phosphate adenosyltransferase